MVRVPLEVRVVGHENSQSSLDRMILPAGLMLRAPSMFAGLSVASMKLAKHAARPPDPMGAKQNYPGIELSVDQYLPEAQLLDAAFGFQNSQRLR